MRFNQIFIVHIKSFTFSLFVFFIATCLSGCNNKNTTGRESAGLRTSSNDTAKISFNEYEHDFGKIEEGEKVACVFTFKNKGNGSLVIGLATTSCGCTVPKYDNKPIAPGGTGSLEVVFDSSGRNGKQTKTITVRSNASKPIVLLRITAEVISNNNN